LLLVGAVAAGQGLPVLAVVVALAACCRALQM
jgi:hypothetical protein